jgi:hypothetical protein
LGQLLTYRVTVGGGYLVTGSRAGNLSRVVTGSDGLCEEDDTLDPRLVSRIPIDAPLCQNLPAIANSKAFVIDADTPASVAGDHDFFSVVRTAQPGACLFPGGGSAADTTPGQTHVRALFRNSETAFALTDVDLQPAGGFSSVFEVNGGFRPQTIVYPSTVEISMPARIVVGPVDSQLQNTNPPSAFEAPYLFVVDQRRLGRTGTAGATRGQIVRINPLLSVTVAGVSGLQPGYEDYTKSNGLFPIQ